jgi:hypothetical protein
VSSSVRVMVAFGCICVRLAALLLDRCEPYAGYLPKPGVSDTCSSEWCRDYERRDARTARSPSRRTGKRFQRTRWSCGTTSTERHTCQVPPMDG